MAADDLPGFLRSAGAEGTLVVHRDFAAAVRELGLPERAAVAALFARARGARGRADTAVAPLPGRPERLRLREVRHGGVFGGLLRDRIYGLGRPLAELRVTETLRERGAPVPRVVLAVGWRVGPFSRAVLGTLEIEGARDGVAWLAASPSPAERLATAADAGRAVRAFHEAGGRHADLHLKNLLVRTDGSIVVIDLDKARAGAAPSPRRRMRELMRLYRSLVKRDLLDRVGPEATQAFFDAYTGGDASLARALLVHLPRERLRIARHALGYRRPG